MEQALVARATGDAALFALVGDRVSWDERPQHEALPAITFQVIPSPVAQHYKGEQALQRVRVQADVWAATYASKKEVAAALRAALLPPATVDDVIFSRAHVLRDGDLPASAGEGFAGPGPAKGMHRRSIDFAIWHKPA